MAQPEHIKRRFEIERLSAEMIEGTTHKNAASVSRVCMINFLMNSYRFRKIHPPPISINEHGYFEVHYSNDLGEAIDITFIGVTLCKTKLKKYEVEHDYPDSTILNTWNAIRSRSLEVLM